MLDLGFCRRWDGKERGLERMNKVCKQWTTFTCISCWFLPCTFLVSHQKWSLMYQYNVFVLSIYMVCMFQASTYILSFGCWAYSRFYVLLYNFAFRAALYPSGSLTSNCLLSDFYTFLMCRIWSLTKSCCCIFRDYWANKIWNKGCKIRSRETRRRWLFYSWRKHPA